MLRPLRTAIGLGEIPAEHNNSPNKSANARIKAKVDYKKSELRRFCQEMKGFIDSQTHHIESAFTMDIGPYAVSDPYHKHKQNPRSWVKESKASLTDKGVSIKYVKFRCCQGIHLSHHYNHPHLPL